MAWWITYEDLSRATRFVSHSRLVILPWCTTTFQVRSTNFHSYTFLSFSRQAGTQFADSMTCLTIQRILFQFEQIPFLLVHTCLSLLQYTVFQSFAVFTYQFVFIRSAERSWTVTQKGRFHCLGVQEQSKFSFACQHTFMFVSLFPTKSTLPSSGFTNQLLQLK